MGRVQTFNCPSRTTARILIVNAFDCVSGYRKCPSVHATALHYTVLHVISAVSNTPFMEAAKEMFKIWVVLPSVLVL